MHAACKAACIAAWTGSLFLIKIRVKACHLRVLHGYRKRDKIILIATIFKGVISY